MAEEHAEEPTAQQNPPDLTEDDEKPFLRPGQIFWIPEKEHSQGALNLHPDAYNHPCVVLSDKPRYGKYTILMVSEPQTAVRGVVTWHSRMINR